MSRSGLRSRSAFVVRSAGGKGECYLAPHPCRYRVPGRAQRGLAVVPPKCHRVTPRGRQSAQSVGEPNGTAADTETAVGEDGSVGRAATISDDGAYRYDLSRNWGEGGTAVFFLLTQPLNR